ncbi:DUF4166 domain-containing protein [Kiloniella laminariae]|uniref:DUF4166 domain-containing protein n=1 Tax=Kiloniella laminariae TaxID=454162 RepID=A0ABT4LDI1_9PROT|nr:SDR family oxidoreductase [Kiloniella laminariae]MCZ4279158.1 DUF4166 domain-containing protein [Kiloniella laminariae]
MIKTILVVGGYGVFGSRICRLLIREKQFSVLVAGRSLAKARSFCKRYGGTAIHFEREADLVEQLALLSPDLVIDAAGPFQDYGRNPYRLAKAALEQGAHYLDLADSPDFVRGIPLLDDLARAQNRIALSGASTAPAITSVLADHLTAGLDEIALIESAILPGNKAPRGRSLVETVLKQAGQPLEIWRDNQLFQAWSWGSLTRHTLQTDTASSLKGRWSALIELPDLRLFPERYNARAVKTRVGLENPLLHLGLWLLSLLPRFGLIRNLLPLTNSLMATSRLFKPFGTDRGGMFLTVLGTRKGRLFKHSWDLIVEKGDGPFVPALPCLILAQKILLSSQSPTGTGPLSPGARPCLGAFAMEDLEQALATLPASYQTVRKETPSLYQLVLGDAFNRLPLPVQTLHKVQDLAIFHGLASVKSGRNPVAKLIKKIMGFPDDTLEIPLQVTIEKKGNREIWQRKFGKNSFRSIMSRPSTAKPGEQIEQFGPLSFLLALPVSEEGILDMVVIRAYFLGCPLPRWMTPISDTQEKLDERGRFHFSVKISLPLWGHLISYRGWLVPGNQPLAQMSKDEIP